MRHTRRAKVGGKKLGAGQFGTAYSPPLKCLEGNDDIWESSDFISKTIYEEGLENEYRNSFLVKELDPKSEWSITALHACTINPRQTNTNYTRGEDTRQLIFKNGGISLYELLIKPDVPSNANNVTQYINGINDDGQEDPTVFQKLNKDGLSKLVDQVKKILPGLRVLNTKYIHNDIHLGNIVTDGVTPRMIDFANLRPLEEKIAAEQKQLAKCLQINKSVDCDWFNARLHMLLVDEAKSRDIQSLWSELHILLDSTWVKQTFPKKYKGWLTQYKDLARFVDLCPEYALSIMDVPV